MSQLVSGCSSKQHDATLQTSSQKRLPDRAQRAARSDGGGEIVSGGNAPSVVSIEIAVELSGGKVSSSKTIILVPSWMTVVSFEIVVELSARMKGPSSTIVLKLSGVKSVVVAARLVLSELKLLAFVIIVSLETMLELSA